MPVFRGLLPTAAALVATALVTAPVSAEDGAAEAAQPAPARGDTSAAAADQSAVIDEIEVRGRRMSEIDFNLHGFVMDFVLEVAATPEGRGFARWHRRVCIGAHNLDATAAQYLVDRISALAMEVGLEPGEPGCDPNVMIIFATNANEVAAHMVESQPRLFRPSGPTGGLNLNLAALDRFMESDRAVRWWHVSLPVDARTGLPATRLTDHDSPPTIAVAGPSRIYSGVRDDLQRVIIIVDAAKLGGQTWQQLGDYLGVVSLAQIDPNGNPEAFDSILNLFTTPQYYSGLTDWDLAYLRALYSFNQERLPRLQRGALVSQMVMWERAALSADD